MRTGIGILQLYLIARNYRDNPPQSNNMPILNNQTWKHNQISNVHVVSGYV